MEVQRSTESVKTETDSDNSECVSLIRKVRVISVKLYLRHNRRTDGRTKRRPVIGTIKFCMAVKT